MPGGTLHSYLQEHHIMTEQDASRFLRKVVEGLQYLHDMKIIHVNLRVSDSDGGGGGGGLLDFFMDYLMKSSSYSSPTTSY